MATGSFELPEAPTYGLTAPTVQDVYTAVLQTFGEDAAPVWEQLSRAADDGTVEQLIAAMSASPNRLVAMLGRSQQTRLASYRCLSAVGTAVAAAGR